ncbi:MAG: hypothetical protein CMJ62_04580 [Planctomycetaceae bacterium]|nr:hypothetical protein [Planctomycetaceae bacterium]
MFSLNSSCAEGLCWCSIYLYTLWRIILTNSSHVNISASGGAIWEERVELCATASYAILEIRRVSVPGRYVDGMKIPGLLHADLPLGVKGVVELRTVGARSGVVNGVMDAPSRFGGVRVDTC